MEKALKLPNGVVADEYMREGGEYAMDESHDATEALSATTVGKKNTSACLHP